MRYYLVILLTLAACSEPFAPQPDPQWVGRYWYSTTSPSCRDGSDGLLDIDSVANGTWHGTLSTWCAETPRDDEWYPAMSGQVERDSIHFTVAGRSHRGHITSDSLISGSWGASTDWHAERCPTSWYACSP